MKRLSWGDGSSDKTTVEGQDGTVLANWRYPLHKAEMLRAAIAGKHSTVSTQDKENLSKNPLAAPMSYMCARAMVGRCPLVSKPPRPPKPLFETFWHNLIKGHNP